MYLLPIYFCISSFLFSFFFGRCILKEHFLLLIIINCYLSFFISVYIFNEVCFHHINTYIFIFPWLKITTLNIYWSFLFDPLSATMLVVITSISLCANLYSIEYMFYDPHKVRYFTYLSVFTFSMLMLVTSNNVLQLFFGWEFVGISSYLLINFWYSRIQANKSSILAVMVNKIGDIFLLYTCFILQKTFSSLDFNVIFLCLNSYDSYINVFFSCIENSICYELMWNNNCTTLSYIVFYKNLLEEMFLYDISNSISSTNFLFYSNLICIFVFIASICKSAQFGFHFWLAEAMEGPTPVSSLLHAATMVTAGIFLTIRMSFLFDYSTYVPIYIIFLGSITTFFSSIIGVTQNDIKKIVAYSTCSQLGYMYLSTGIFAYSNSMFHLFNHAFFKALLFLSSGYLIHSLSNEQDLRKMGGLIKLLPFGYFSLLIGSMSLMGIPYFSGFFSKDMIIENFYSTFVVDLNNINKYPIIYFSQLIALISVVFTIVYSLKIVFYVFLNSYSGLRYYINNIHFSTYYIILPVFFLALLSMTSGYLTNDLMIGTGTTFWGNSINTSSMVGLFSKKHYYIILFCEFKKYTYYLIFFFSIYYLTLFIYFFFFVSNLFKIKYLNKLFVHLNNKVIFFNKLLISSILYSIYYMSYNVFYKLVDKKIFDFFSSFSIIFYIKNITLLLKKKKLNIIYNPIGSIIFSLIFFFMFFIIII